MLNRKESKPTEKAGRRGRPRTRLSSTKPQRQNRRFIISHKAHSASKLRGSEPPNGAPKSPTASQAKPSVASPQAAANKPAQAADLTEAIKTLLHLAHEHGHVTYDDINDVLPDGLSPEDLDELYTKLRNLDVEIVDHAEVERAKPAEPEEEEDSRLEVLDDPVRMYMNQMGKVPLLTREQSSTSSAWSIAWASRQRSTSPSPRNSCPSHPRNGLTGWWSIRKSPTARHICGSCAG
jgi:RNA polymerase primary sigma factor